MWPRMHFSQTFPAFGGPAIMILTRSHSSCARSTTSWVRPDCLQTLRHDPGSSGPLQLSDARFFAQAIVECNKSAAGDSANFDAANNGTRCRGTRLWSDLAYRVSELNDDVGVRLAEGLQVVRRKLPHGVPNGGHANVLTTAFCSLPHAVSATIVNRGFELVVADRSDLCGSASQLGERIPAQVLVAQEDSPAAGRPVACFFELAGSLRLRVAGPCNTSTQTRRRDRERSLPGVRAQRPAHRRSRAHSHSAGGRSFRR